MGFELREGQGALFNNDDKQSDNQPDLRGQCMIDGVEYWVAGWDKKAQSGAKYVSLSFQRKDASRGGGNGGQRSGGGGRGGYGGQRGGGRQRSGYGGGNGGGRGYSGPGRGQSRRGPQDNGGDDQGGDDDFR